MSYAEGDFWLTYNGEIYNYVELRQDLQALGYTFRSEGDTEVLLAAYAAWGEDCLQRFNGMYAFALWDRRRRRLFCARDRFGIKPFYYYARDGFFAFASEIKALLAHPRIPARPHPQAVYAYLVNGAVDSGAEIGETFFADIHSLPARHALSLEADGTLRLWPYYDLSPNLDYPAPRFEAQAEAFGALMTDAVRLHLRSDVPLGSALSGGLDSSSLVLLINRLLQEENGVHQAQIGERQRVYCAVYEGERFNERPYMQAVIEATGAKATFTQPNAQKLAQDLEKLVWHQDEPMGATSVFAQYCVMEAARQDGVTVLLDGQGADETLAGYSFYYGYLLAQALREGRFRAAYRQGRGALAHTSAPLLTLLTAYNLAPSWARMLGLKLGGRRWLSHKPLQPAWIQPDFRHGFAQVAPLKHQAFPTLAQKLYDDVFRSNLPTLLRYEDRNSMAFHIEARVPFLDYRLVEAAFHLPSEAHIRAGKTKALLRQAMRHTLPAPIQARRDKQGYTTPHQAWLEALTPRINAFFAGSPRSAAYLTPQALASLSGPQAAHMEGVWRALNLEAWLCAFHLSP
jgi:asparagine synthase (glutamine-hydrolysing)